MCVASATFHDARCSVVRLDLEEAGLSSMQVAETDMAKDKNVPVLIVKFNAESTAADVKGQLEEALRAHLV